MEKCRPKLKETVWAGTKLSRRFGKEGIGEAYLFFGEGDGDKLKKLPLLKYIDAAGSLSVQVHPKGNEGKNEMWLIDGVYEDGAVWLGLKEDIPVEDVEKSCENGRVLELLRRCEVKKGDFFFIPGGMVHCARGISFFEVQNHCDVTYRLFDFHRGRALQREEGLHCLERNNDIFSGFPFDLSEVSLNDAPLCEVSEGRGDSVFVCLSERGEFCGSPCRKADCYRVSPSEKIFGKGSFLRADIVGDGMK